MGPWRHNKNAVASSKPHCLRMHDVTGSDVATDLNPLRENRQGTCGLSVITDTQTGIRDDSGRGFLHGGGLGLGLACTTGQNHFQLRLAGTAVRTRLEAFSYRRH